MFKFKGVDKFVLTIGGVVIKYLGKAPKNIFKK